MTELNERRKWFDSHSKGISLGGLKFFKKIDRVSCPCCGYPTLAERGGYNICCICNWEDDGQDDSDSSRAGSPNKGYSLDSARENFIKYLIMYPPDNNTNIGGGDSKQRIELKKQLISVFEKMLVSETSKLKKLWLNSFKIQKELGLELERVIRAYERSIKS